ncbi:UDP-N-acetylglucosamine 1-carboxyvinyltransferase [Akkermansiaceae bacterium]|nr:UDP-N-acetylglucosamine 1-carboxyvinyltransferase [Akkermansiaceae bacterium]
MDTIKIQKSSLRGQVKLSGAKNAALKHLTASVLTSEDVIIDRAPNDLLDMQVHIKMLEKMGKNCHMNGEILTIREKKINPELIWNERSIRNSLLILGCLTTRFGEGKVPLPGGCKLGDRKIDLHVMILRALGAKVWEEDGYLCAKAEDRLKGADIKLSLRSTGATENGILCATLAQGKTTIWNPHIRPEVVDLVAMLNNMGAKIRIFGQKCIEILGVDGLSGVTHQPIPDNMEALTWAIGAAITDGNLEILDFPFQQLEIPLIHLRESGLKYYRGETSLIIKGSEPYPVEISTGPYPGINSDMQPLLAVFGAMSKGESRIIDLRFPGRYGYAEELAKMGMNYQIDGQLLKIHGGNSLTGAKVRALDLRAGIALVLAGLTAEGETTIENAWQIHRGYENLVTKLKGMGVTIS